MNSLDISALRDYMRERNLRTITVEDWGESTKVTFSYHDGKTSEKEVNV